jgi:hypothetical protein
LASTPLYRAFKGVAVLLLQSKYDHAIDARFGTLRANLVRILLTTACKIFLFASDTLITVATASDFIRDALL